MLANKPVRLARGATDYIYITAIAKNQDLSLINSAILTPYKLGNSEEQWCNVALAVQGEKRKH